MFVHSCGETDLIFQTEAGVALLALVRENRSAILMMLVFEFFENWDLLQDRKVNPLQGFIRSPEYQRPKYFTLACLRQA